MVRKRDDSGLVDLEAAFAGFALEPIAGKAEAAHAEGDDAEPSAQTWRGRGQRGTLRVRGKLYRIEWRDPPDSAGKRPQRSLPVGPVDELSRKEARTLADRIMAERAPRASGATVIDWRTWRAEYLDDHLHRLRRRSRPVVKSQINAWHTPFGRPRTLWLHDIDKRLVQRCVDRFAKACKPSTVGNLWGALRRMLNAAHDAGYLTAGLVAGDITLPRDDRIVGKAGPFTPDELRCILGAAVEPWLSLYLILARLGIRNAEALGLMWQDFDFARRRVRIERQAVRIPGREGMQLTAPKTAASVRSIRLPPRLAAHLADRQRELGVDVGLLFPSPAGGPYDPSGIRRHHLRPLLEQLGIESRGRSFHSFRRALGTEAMRAGISLSTVQHMLGHSDARTTQRYITVFDGDVDDAFEALEARNFTASGDD